MYTLVQEFMAPLGFTLAFSVLSVIAFMIALFGTYFCRQKTFIHQ
jgi:hypothetical protein